MKKVSIGCSDGDIDILFNTCDADKSGSISCEEFFLKIRVRFLSTNQSTANKIYSLTHIESILILCKLRVLLIKHEKN